MNIAKRDNFYPIRHRNLWAAFLALIMIATSFAGIVGNVGATDAYEPDDSYTQATIIPTDGTSQRHDFDPAGDEDWLNFTIAPGTIYTIETLNLSYDCDTYMELIDTNGVTVLDWNHDSGEGQGSRIVWNSTGFPGGYYYVRITESDGNGGPGYSYDVRIFEGIYAELSPPHSDFGLDTDGDSLFNYLVVNVQVKIYVEGQYQISASLRNNTGIFLGNGNNNTFLPAGLHTMEIRIPGYRIFTNGDSGSYIVDIRLYDGTGNFLESDAHNTISYLFDEFDPPPANFAPPHTEYGLDTDSDLLFNFLIVEVSVNVVVSGDYQVQGTLRDSQGGWIESDYNNTFLTPGIKIVWLQFTGLTIYNEGDNGTYNVTLELRDDNWDLIDADRHMTRFFYYDEFQRPPAYLTGNFNDWGLDTDSDSLFNFLVIEVELEVLVAGDYYVSIDIHHNESGDHLGWNSSEITYYSVGIHTVLVYFDGHLLREKGYNGSYKLYDVRIYDNSNSLDNLYNSHITQDYNWTLFQHPPAEFLPPHSDSGRDTDGNPLFDYLVINVSVYVNVAGDYRIQGSLYDSSSNQIVGVNNYTYLPVGIHIVEIRFDGWRIYNNGDNGLYTISLSIYDDSGKWLDSNTHITNFYNYDQFQPPPGKFEPPYSDHGLDTDTDLLFNYLVVNARVNVTVPGDFEIRGILRDSSMNSLENVYNYTFLTAGVHTVELGFEGWRIYKNGDNCSYTVDLYLEDDSNNNIDSDTYLTGFYNFDEFQLPPAGLKPPHSDHGLDTDGDLYFNYLIVSVVVNVNVAGDYRISGDLYDGTSNYMGGINNYTYLTTGVQTVELWFEGWRIHSDGENGTYYANLNLYDDTGKWLDSDTHNGNWYNYDQFQPPPAKFQPPHSEYGLDTDGDFLFNYLIVNVTVNVDKAGDYRIYSDLRDSSMSYIEGVNNFTYLASGLQIVVLRFEGWLIYQNGDNGTYSVSFTLRDDTGKWLDYDTHDANFYNYDQFELPPGMFLPPHSDHGLDTDSDNFYNYLIVNATVKINDAGNYEIRGRLRDSSMYIVETIYNNTFLGAGIHTVEIRFDGKRIRANGDNCSYTVELRLRESSGITVDTDTYLTGFYNYDEFQPPPAMFFYAHSHNVLDTNGDGYYDYLVVNVFVDVNTAGDFEIRGRLYDSFMNSVETIYNNTFLNTGIQIVELWFDGQRIRANGDNCSYTVDLRLWDSSGMTLDTDTYITNFYTYDEFQPPPAMLEPPHSDYGLDTDSDNYFNYFIVNARVNVTLAGNYRFECYLRDSSNNWIHDDYNTTWLGPGIRTVEFRFEGWRIYSNGDSGNYNVEFRIYDNSWNFLDSDYHQTNFYTYDEFQPPPALFKPPHSDNGLDTNSDSLFNFLVVNAFLEVSSDGDYRVEGTLRDSSSNWIQNVNNFTYLAVGVTSVKLYFEGWRIFNNGDNCSYTVELRVRDYNGNILDTDAYSTNFYTYDVFQPPNALLEPPHSDNGLDTDGDGYYNFLVIDVVVKVSEAGDYRVYGTLRDSSNNYVEDVYNYTTLAVGIHTVKLFFEGWKIHQNEDNCSFTVNLQVRDDSGNTLDTDTYSTNFYTYDEFQPPPARFHPPHSDYGLDTDGDGLYNYLVVSVSMNVSSAGDFWMESYLRDSSFSFIDDIYNSTTMSKGIRTFDIYFDGWKVFNRGDNGSYNLNMWLYDDSWDFLDSDSYTTNFYTFDQFQPPPALFFPPHSDFALDTDSDSDFNYLVVNAQVNVSAAGDYQVRGILRDSSNNWIQSLDNFTSLAKGIQIVQLYFEGWMIFNNRDNGSYNVELRIYDSSGDRLDTDSHTTNFYTFDEFEPPPAYLTRKFNDYGLDTDGDPYYNLLVIEVEVEVTDAGNYFVGVDLHHAGSFDHIRENSSILTFLPVGTHKISVYFESFDLWMSGYDGPYILDDVWLYDENWNDLDYLDDPYTTGPYSLNDFQPLTTDTTPPSTISDVAVVGSTGSTITLRWTAPGDDGMSGTASSYELRYSISGPINDANWASAAIFTQSWSPLPAGSTETRDVTGLSSATQYWFAIKARDEVPNISGISNSPSGSTLDNLPPQILNVLVNGLSSVTVTPGTMVTLTATLDDSSTGNAVIGGANYTIGSQNWPGISLSPLNPPLDSSGEAFTITIDTSAWGEGTYDLYVYGWDAVPNYYLGPSFATIIIDPTPPANITDLAVVTTEATLATLTWTATGDDGTTGTATSYEVRYSTSGPITDANWGFATMFLQSWVPLSSGSSETHDVTGLSASTQYWFAIRVGDEVPSWSTVSNSATGTTLADDVPPQILNIRVNGENTIAVTAGVVVTLTATISDALAGNSAIGGANCTQDPADWPNAVAMVPVDGTFDSSIEDVSLVIDTTGWAADTYKLYVYAWDIIPNHNTASSAYATIFIDPTPPVSSVDAISPYWSSGSTRVTASASDAGSWVEDVRLFYMFSSDNSSWGSWILYGTDSEGPWEWDFDFPEGDGYYRLKTMARDGANNTEADSGSDVECGCDTRLPSSSLNEISPYWSLTSHVTITTTASDEGSGLVGVELFYRYSTDNSTWGVWTFYGIKTQAPWEWSFDFPEGEGFYEFFTVAFDKAMNEAGTAPSGVTCGYDLTQPTADAGLDKEVPTGSKVTFDGSGSGDNVLVLSLKWTFDDGGMQTLYGTYPTYTFENPGEYLVTLEVTDSAGNTHTDTMTVNVGGVTTPGSISGRITDEKGNPVLFAIVSVEGTNLKAATGVDGSYVIMNVPPGTYDLTVTKSGYKDQTISDVTVSPGQETQNEAFAMKKSPEGDAGGFDSLILIVLIIAIALVLVLVMVLLRSKKGKRELVGGEESLDEPKERVKPENDEKLKELSEK